jgi:threonine dehydrogenase-like Zn-dependent dehydrogenase
MTENARYNKLALRLMGQIDVFLDISATGIKNPPQLEVGFVSLKPKGRVSLMGSYEEVKIPDDHHIRGKDITLKTFWTYKREDVPPVIKMVENGDLKLSKELGGIGSSFGLHRWKFAVERASISDESIFLTPQLLY